MLDPVRGRRRGGLDLVLLLRQPREEAAPALLLLGLGLRRAPARGPARAEPAPARRGLVAQ